MISYAIVRTKTDDAVRDIYVHEISFCVTPTGDRQRTKGVGEKSCRPLVLGR